LKELGELVGSYQQLPKVAAAFRSSTRSSRRLVNAISIRTLIFLRRMLRPSNWTDVMPWSVLSTAS
jgi:hypothetical protein